MASPIATGTMRYHHMLVAEAAIRDGWGDPSRWLRSSEAFFTDAGFDVIARRCRSLLAQTGAAVPRRRGASVVPQSLRALGVTGRETDVLRLIAAGRSNREVAEALVLSPKTVERHVASLFDRTGIRNRRDLGAFARTQQGWDPPLN
jgi:DNA-binding NarL/FixJ family response regulator